MRPPHGADGFPRVSERSSCQVPGKRRLMEGMVPGAGFQGGAWAG